MGKLFYITLNTKGAEENSIMKNVISKKKSTQRKKTKMSNTLCKRFPSGYGIIGDSFFPSSHYFSAFQISYKGNILF